jgi:uncharacterized RDD family membrane protein YckC
VAENDGLHIKPADENTGDVPVTGAVAAAEAAAVKATSEALPPPVPGLHYAPFGTRIAAFFTDGVLEAVLQGVLSIFLGGLAAAFLKGAGLAGGVGVFGVAGDSISNAYVLLWWGCGAFNRLVIQWYFGGTVGKLVFGIRVAELDGGEVRFMTCLKRYLFAWVSLFPMGLGYLAPLWTARKQTFHDMAAGSVVLERH